MDVNEFSERQLTFPCSCPRRLPVVDLLMCGSPQSIRNKRLYGSSGCQCSVSMPSSPNNQARTHIAVKTQDITNTIRFCSLRSSSACTVSQESFMVARDALSGGIVVCLTEKVSPRINIFIQQPKQGSFRQRISMKSESSSLRKFRAEARGKNESSSFDTIASSSNSTFQIPSEVLFREHSPLLRYIGVLHLVPNTLVRRPRYFY